MMWIPCKKESAEHLLCYCICLSGRVDIHVCDGNRRFVIIISILSALPVVILLDTSDPRYRFVLMRKVELTIIFLQEEI